MKVKIKTNEKGYCDCFEIDGKKYGTGIYELDIKISAYEKPEIVIKAKNDEFILDSEDTKLYLEKYKDED